MSIRMVEDLASPAVVTVVDIVTKETAPDWNEWAAYIIAAAGYVGGMMNFGGPFVKNMGVASFDWAANAIYNRIKGGTQSRVVNRKVAFSPATPRVARSYQPEFEGAGARAF